MSGLTPQYRSMLDDVLRDDFIPSLPRLLNQTRPQPEKDRKNLSRAFSAFALRQVCSISTTDASAAVVDDFDDFGIDAIYFHAPDSTLYIVQAKLKASDMFSQDEALAFCQGIRKVVREDFSGFNSNVQKRSGEIENALGECRSIRLVVAHTGNGVSAHARHAIEEILNDESHGEERFDKKLVDYDAACVVRDLQAAKAYPRVDADLRLQKYFNVQEPRVTYFGLMNLTDLVLLHQKYGPALYANNIRTFLGHKTDVNASIRTTLAEAPEDFLYLNNGIAALCNEIEPKNNNQAGKRLKVRGFSVINGAQTIASAAKLVSENADADISKARVQVALIKAASGSAFGKSVTQARNHQNQVSLSDFVALDDEQERLRRDLAYLGVNYIYKAGVAEYTDAQSILHEEAAQALALLQCDPRVAVWLKREPSRFLDTESDAYKSLFTPALTPFLLVNSVRCARYVYKRILTESRAAHGLERLVYKHGVHALAWVLVKRVRRECEAPKLVDEIKVAAVFGPAFDILRQLIWTKAEPLLVDKGPLAFFRNQTDVLRLLESLMIDDYGLAADPAVAKKQGQQNPKEPYPTELFGYLVSKAPQIGGLA